MRGGSHGRALLAAGVAIGVLPIVGADPAYACSCVQTDEQQRYEQATHVFKGTVLAAQGAASTDGESSDAPVLYTFDVISTYKGRVTDPQKVSTPGNSAACGIDLDGDGPFLVFASRPPVGNAQTAGAELTMNLCGGTRPIGANDEPTFGRSPATAPEQEPPQAPKEEPQQEPQQEPADPPSAEPEKGPGLTATIVRNVGEVLDEVGGLAGDNPPPGR